MFGSDHGWWNAARVEIDHRAREARLRLEHLERLLISRVLPTPSEPKRVVDRRGLRFFRAGCVRGQSTKVVPPGPRYGHPRHIPTEICVAVQRLTAVGGTARPRSPA
jgi:hypothetical protein